MPKSPDPSVHVVEPGDRLSRIAFLHGYASVAAVWDAPENAELRRKRKNPEILMPGDRVFLPPRTAEAHPAPDQAETRLAHATIPSEIHVKLVFDGQPIAPRGKVRVRIDTDPYTPEEPYEGEVTLADGVARFHVDPRVTEVVLTSEDPAFSLRLLVGHLQPIDEPSGVGVEQRLSNLDHRCPLPPRGRNRVSREGQRVLGPRAAHQLARFHAKAGPGEPSARDDAPRVAGAVDDAALALLTEKSRA